MREYQRAGHLLGSFAPSQVVKGGVRVLQLPQARTWWSPFGGLHPPRGLNIFKENASPDRPPEAGHAREAIAGYPVHTPGKVYRWDCGSCVGSRGQSAPFLELQTSASKNMCKGRILTIAHASQERDGLDATITRRRHSIQKCWNSRIDVQN